MRSSGARPLEFGPGVHFLPGDASGHDLFPFAQAVHNFHAHAVRKTRDHPARFRPPVVRQYLDYFAFRAVFDRQQRHGQCVRLFRRDDDGLHGHADAQAGVAIVHQGLAVIIHGRAG